ncbi:hypothetical protein [Peterkaempfera sp. SMS 1(5)a]|uniref:hypothetical protein n=1 Tax=Peterkaempfera podocarpi TaxID=3232308 RepID=UPI00366A7A55
MSSGNSTGERDPFAPPPADAPDRPWQPRAPQPPTGGTDPRSTPPSPHAGEGDRPDDGNGPGGRPPVPPPHPWSPGWQGRPPGGPYPPSGPQQRYDPTDPVQRRARYALLSGMWGLFFMIFNLPYVGLLLGALAVYWGISALRGTPKAPAAAGADQRPGAGSAGSFAGSTSLPPAPPPTGRQPAPLPPPGWAAPRQARPQLPAALGGLVTGGVALVMVAASWGLQLAYKDYYDCVSDALTQKAQHSCSKLIPDWLQKADNVNNG